jgi:hypothetical protein
VFRRHFRHAGCSVALYKSRVDQTRGTDDELARPERNPAKEQLVSTLAAGWGATMAERAIPRIKAAPTDPETRAILETLRAASSPRPEPGSASLSLRKSGARPLMKRYASG